MSDDKFAALICLLLAAAALIFAYEAEAADWRPIEPREITLEYKSFMPGGYRPTLNGNGLENRTLGKEVVLRLNTDFLSVFFFNNRVHGGTDERVDAFGRGTGKGQFRDVGWNFELGVRPFSFLSLLIEHHSQHMLDYSTPGRFPVEDSAGIRLHLFSNPRPGKTIF